MTYYVFRQNWDERIRLFEEITKGRLRQGWSYSAGMSLDQGEDTYAASFAGNAAHPKHFEQLEEGRSRYAILRPLRLVQPGDILVVPKQPDYDHFLLLIAAKNPTREAVHSYDFTDPLPGTDDYRSVIYIDPGHVKAFHFDGKDVPPIMKQKLRSIGYSSAVNVVGNGAFIAGIRQCLGLDDPSAQQPEPLKAKLTMIREKMYRNWVQSVRELTPSDFEKLVRVFMEASDYHIVRLNNYDGAGHDVDLECERTFEFDDPLGTSQTVRYRIQVKKYEGCCDAHAVRQLLDERPTADGGVQTISVVISTADDFTDECKRLAEEHDVGLMNGVEFARAYFRSVEKDE